MGYKLILYFTFLIVIFCNNLSIAAISIDTVSGSITHGQNITISGSAFGVKPTSPPSLWDTVENQYTLSDGATIPTGGSYPWDAQCVHGGGACVKYESTTSEQRGKSTAAYKSINANYAYMEGRQVTNTGKMYISWWWKPSIDPVYQSSKFLRLSDSSDIVNKTFSWTMMHNYVYVSGCNPINWAASWAEVGGLTNQWNFMEAWIDSSTETYTLRINGNPASANNYSFSSCGPISFDYVLIVGQDGDSAETTMTSWMDDIYVDNTFSRVMIGNASTYAASTHFEMQVPSAWSTSSITATVNQGSFADGATAYLYVVDSTGSVNSSGFQITFGAAQAGTNSRMQVGAGSFSFQ